MKKLYIAFALISFILVGIALKDTAIATINGNKGDLMINVGGDTGYDIFTVCADGKIMKASSTASLGWECGVLAGGGDMISSNNLSDLVSTSSARGNLGVSATSSRMVAIVVDKIYTNQTAARNTWGNSTINYMFGDFTGVSSCRTIAQTTVAGVNNNTKVQVQYSPDSQTTFYQLDGSSATGATSTSVGAVSIGVANASSSAWVSVSSTFKQSVYLRISAWDGNGTADPAISAFVECF